MSGVLFDTNVVLDIATCDPQWEAWSEEQYRRASAQGCITINPVICAELSPAFDCEADLDDWLDPAVVFQRDALPWQAAWLAGQAFVNYRRRGGSKTSPLPDFFIGAHAEVMGLTVVTRDAVRFRTYFPSVVLITP